MGPVNRRRVLALTGTAVVVALVLAAAIAATRSPECGSYPDAHNPDITHELCGPILQHYRSVGGPNSVHGLPDSDERAASSSNRRYGDREVGFANGAITVDTRTGETSSAYWERSN